VFSVSRAARDHVAQAYTKYQKRKIINIEDYERSGQLQGMRRSGCNAEPIGRRAIQRAVHDRTSIRGLTWTMLDLNSTEIAIGRGFTPATMNMRHTA